MESLPQQRFFWRRVLAYFIDSIVFQLTIGLVLLVALSFALPETTMFNNTVEPNAILSDSQKSVLATRFGENWEEQYSAVTMSASALLRKPVTVMIVAAKTHPDGAVSFPLFLIDRGSGTFVELDWGDYLPWIYANLLLFPLLFAWMNAAGRRSFGKKSANLAIVRVINGEPPGLATMIIRETLKFGIPIILELAMGYLIIGLLSDLFSGGINLADAALMKARFGQAMSLGFACWLAVIAYWLVPFIWWRGQTFYDRLCGLKVIDQIQVT